MSTEATATDSTIAPPLIDLPIRTASRGFYDGFSRAVTIPSKIIVSLLIMWAIFFPVSASETLNAANSTIIATFAGWYVYLVAFLMLVCFALALVPSAGRLRIGEADEKARVQPVLLVRHAVRRGNRDRHADLFDRRTAGAFQQQPRHHPRCDRGPQQRGGAPGLCLHLPPLGLRRLGHLRARRAGDRLRILSPRPAADDPLGARPCSGCACRGSGAISSMWSRWSRRSSAWR